MATEGLRLIRGEPAFVGVLTAAYVAVWLAAAIGGLAILGPTIAQLATTTPDSAAEILSMMGRFAALFALMLPALLILHTMVGCAIFRAVLRPDDEGFFYFKLGGDEWRMFLASLALVGLMFGILLVLGGVIGAATLAGEAWAALAIFLGTLLGLVGMTYAGVRLSLALPMTFAERQVRVLSAWSLTRGLFWPLLGGYLLAWLIAIGVGMALGIISEVISAGASLATILTQDSSPLGLSALTPALVAGMVVSVIGSALQTVVTSASPASAYTQLSGKTASVADTFA